MKQASDTDFIDQPQEESSGMSLKGLAHIEWAQVIMHNMLFIVWLTILGVVYITNRYHAERIARQTEKMKTEVNELRAESITTANQLMNLSRQSVVSSLVKEKGLQINEPVKPPYVIKK